MKRKSQLPELLAPAGNMKALYAAVEAGADAVYVGGKNFGARAFAQNFDAEELIAAVRYCHLHGVRIYVTVNTLVFDREVRELSDYAAFLWEIGVDAVIVADLGAVRIIRERVPDLEVHASTQMSVHNTDGARAAARLGCKRVVVARELACADICEITNDSQVEIEVFLHGALCVCHSGQCLFSSLVGGRSGNRGECAQPCRLPYNGKYPLSLSDLSLAGHITELIDSGVASLKIEGRMKSPDYVYSVTSVYRRLLDEKRNATRKEHVALARIFSRGGEFTDSYFKDDPFSRMTGVRSDDDKSFTKNLSGREFVPVKKRVSASASFRIGQECRMTVSDGIRSVSVSGDVVGKAISVPLTEDGLKERLSKTGNTFLSLAKSDVTLELDEGANLSPGAVNALRRKATEAFEQTEKREAPLYQEVPTRGAMNPKFKTALFLNTQSLLRLDERHVRAFDMSFAPIFSPDEVFERVNGAYLPPVLRNRDIEKVRRRLSELKEKGLLYTLVGNIGAIELSLDVGLVPVGDTRLNVTNSYTAATLAKLGVDRLILSAELDLPKARDIGGAVTVYGRIPLMLTERCFVKENFSCSSCGKASFTDRVGKSFPIIREYEHRNLVLNSEITYMADRIDDVRGNALSEHFIFTTESAEQIAAVIRAFARKKAIDTVFPGERPRRLGMRSLSTDKKH